MYRINCILYCTIIVRKRSVSRVSNSVLYVCFVVAINKIKKKEKKSENGVLTK